MLFDVPLLVNGPIQEYIFDEPRNNKPVPASITQLSQLTLIKKTIIINRLV